MRKYIFLLVLLIGNVVLLDTMLADELVVYTQPTENYWQLWICNLTTNTYTQLTSSDYDKKTPAWSPSGEKILYRSGNGELYVYDIKGKEEEKILSDVQYCADPSWLTEQEILFTRYRTDTIDDSDIWLVNLKTKERKVLVSEPGLQFQPLFSKDGEKIVYVSALNPQSHQVFIKDLKSGKTKQITQIECYNFMPCFSPDRKSIAFVSNQTGNNEIYIIDIAGNNIKQLTNNSGIDTDPKWIDNNTIIYSSYINGKFQINKIDINSLELSALISRDVDCCNPDWIKK